MQMHCSVENPNLAGVSSHGREGDLSAAPHGCTTTVRRQHSHTLSRRRSPHSRRRSRHGADAASPRLLQGFAQPTNFTFTYPNNTGIAISFTDDGHFEEAQYRFESNGASSCQCLAYRMSLTCRAYSLGTEPRCVKAIVIWQHGNYTIQPNNVSIAKTQHFDSMRS